MTAPDAVPPGAAPEPDSAAPVTVAGRLSTYLRGGGIITPIITVIRNAGDVGKTDLVKASGTWEAAA